jgi:hypothetical protein
LHRLLVDRKKSYERLEAGIARRLNVKSNKLLKSYLEPAGNARL